MKFSELLPFWVADNAAELRKKAARARHQADACQPGPYRDAMLKLAGIHERAAACYVVAEPGPKQDE